MIFSKITITRLLPAGEIYKYNVAHKSINMKKLIFFSLILIGFIFTYSIAGAQTFLNGNFEKTTSTLGVDDINLSNDAFNQKMSYSYAFGSYGDMDIISTAIYNGLPQEGNYFVAFTGGETDAISMELSSPLIPGKSYTISFWDRASSGYAPQPFQIGVSNDKAAFGTLIYTADLPIVGEWSQRIFTFKTTESFKYITVKLNGQDNIGDWAQADNFKFVTPDISITTGKINGSPFCACSALNIPFTTTGTFPAETDFTAQLSDASGSFSNPINIGTVTTSENHAVIDGILPCNIPAGTAYRIRVISTTPDIIGADNKENLTINQGLTASVNIAVTPSSVINKGTSLTFKATLIDGGQNPKYQWMINGEKKGINSSTFTSSDFSDGDVITLTVFTNSSCSSSNEVASNQIIVTVKTPAAPAVGINATTPTSIEKGESVTFLATPTNGGTHPLYQWKVNGVPCGAGGATFVANGLKDGDAVTVVMTSNAEGLSTNMAYSNSINVSVHTPETNNVVSQGGFISDSKHHAKSKNKMYLFLKKHSIKRLLAHSYKSKPHNKKNIGHCHKF
jgi:hypothetical protein